MNKKIFLILGLLLFSLFVSVPDSQASTLPQVQAKVTKELDNSFTVKLTWKFTTGDRLWTSTDGSTWSEITFTAPALGENVSVIDPAKRNSHTIVYYEVRNGSNERRVNVFPGTGTNYENQHGNYDKNTNTCVNCHATHKAESALLLTENTVMGLCDTCHSAAVSGGVGSRYMTDIGGVEAADGKYHQALGGLFGRPLNPLDTTSPNPLNSSAVSNTYDITAIINDVWKDYKVENEDLTNATSIHIMESSDPTLIAPGDSSPTRKWTGMTCTTCHQGHPNDNNYRLLKSNINGTDIGLIEAYAVSDGSAKLDSHSGMNMVETSRYINGINAFCAQCHGVFNVRTGAATTTPNASNHYLHPVGEDMTYTPFGKTNSLTLTTTLPVDEGNNILCISCHFAHGTPVADQSIQASNYIDGTSSSMLKRRANQTICQDCHKK